MAVKRPSSPPGPCPAGTRCRVSVQADDIDWSWGSPPSTFSCCLFCCPWCLGQGPRCLSPHTRNCMSFLPLIPLTLLPYPFPVTLHRADPSYAIGLLPTSPEKPSVAVAVLAVFAFFPIVTEARAGKHPVQTVAVLLLPTLAPFHQSCFLLKMSLVGARLWQRHLQCGLPKITAFNHFAHVQNGEFKAAQPS